MPVRAIWAQARDAAGRPVIGKDGDMPWHLPDDLARFQRLTTGHVVIMGRHTWESLPERFRPLPGRINIVVTSLPSLDGAPVAASFDDALVLADTLGPGLDRWIIGGARLFHEAVRRRVHLEVTEIDLEVEGDTFAPDIPEGAYAALPGEWIDNAGPRHRYVTYVNR